MGQIHFINRFFHPDFSATSQMLTDLTTSLAGNYKVTVVTSRKLYNDPLVRLNRRDEHQGVEILRLNTHPAGTGALVAAGIRLPDVLSGRDVVAGALR